MGSAQGGHRFPPQMHGLRPSDHGQPQAGGKELPPGAKAGRGAVNSNRLLQFFATTERKSLQILDSYDKLTIRDIL